MLGISVVRTLGICVSCFPFNLKLVFLAASKWYVNFEIFVAMWPRILSFWEKMLG